MDNESNERMIRLLMERGYVDEKVADAMRKVPRSFFVPKRYEINAYDDHPLPIGYGQTISAPSVVGFMTMKLEVKKGMRVLEIGAGSGWQAGLLGELVGKEGEVYSVERIPELVELAKANIAKLAYDNIFIIYGDGTKGYVEKAPYERIIVTAASPGVPAPLKEQLKDGGKLIIPVGNRYWQELLLIEKNGEKFTESALMSVVFVPLIGEYGFR